MQNWKNVDIKFILINDLRFYRIQMIGCIMVACFLVLGGCKKAELLTNIPDEEKSLVKAREVDCVMGNTLDFPIDAGPTGLDSPDYYAVLITGPYSNDECMCKIDGYRLVFEGIFSEIDLKIWDSNGEEVIFSLTIENGNTIIEIYDVGKLPDSGLTIFVDFLDFPEQGPVPDLLGSGGLCIIDNISGLGSPIILYEAYVEYSHKDTVGDSIFNAFIPAAIGSIHVGSI